MGRERVGRVGCGWGADNTVAVRRGRLVCNSETHGGWSAKRDVYEGSGEEGSTKKDETRKRRRGENVGAAGKD